VNVYVETNFVLELALEQQESLACERLLQLAQASAIRLLVPAYSLIEPHEALTRRHLDREALRTRVVSELKQLGRSTHLAQRAAASQELVDLFAYSAEFEADRIERAKERVLSAADVLPLNHEVLRSAARYKAELELSPQDAVVYASLRARLDVDHDLPSCFVSRNPRDFKDLRIHRDLITVNCRYFSSFEIALRYIEHTIKRP
jgi:predicted nucleic acid-binding protein